MSAPSQVLLCTYDVLPGPTGTSRRLAAYVKALTDRFEVSVLSIKTPELSHIERFHGARLLRVPVGNGDLHSRLQAFDRAVRRQLGSEEYALVHVAGPFGGYAACEERARHGYRMIYEGLRFPSQELAYFHPELEGDRRFLSRVRRQELFCLMNADRVVTGSGPTQAFVRALGVSRENVKVVRAPAELSLYPESFPPPGHATPRALYLGNQAPYQGLPTVFRALARCEEPLELVIAGPRHSDWEPQLRELARELGVAERVEFQPLTSNTRMAELLADSDIGLLPLEDCERNRLQGGPLAKASEYLAAGRPVIASDLPVTRDLLPADATVFVPAGDVERWAAALSELAQDAPRRIALGHEGRAFAASHLDPAAIGRTIGALYQELLVGRSGKLPERKPRGPQEETLVRSMPDELGIPDTDKSAPAQESPPTQPQLPISARPTLESPIPPIARPASPPPPAFVPPPPGSKVIPGGMPRASAPLPSPVTAQVATDVRAGFVPPPAEPEETTAVSAPREKLPEEDFTETTYVPLPPEGSPWQEPTQRAARPKSTRGRERTQIVSASELEATDGWSAQPLRKVGVAMGLAPSAAETEDTQPSLRLPAPGAFDDEPTTPGRAEREHPRITPAQTPISRSEASARRSAGSPRREEGTLPAAPAPWTSEPGAAARGPDASPREDTAPAATPWAERAPEPSTQVTGSGTAGTSRNSERTESGEGRWAPSPAPGRRPEAAPPAAATSADAPHAARSTEVTAPPPRPPPAASARAPLAAPEAPLRQSDPPGSAPRAALPAIPKAPGSLPIARPPTAPELPIPVLGPRAGPEEVDADEVLEADDIAEPIDDPNEIAALVRGPGSSTAGPASARPLRASPGEVPVTIFPSPQAGPEAPSSATARPGARPPILTPPSLPVGPRASAGASPGSGSGAASVNPPPAADPRGTNDSGSATREAPPPLPAATPSAASEMSAWFREMTVAPSNVPATPAPPAHATMAPSAPAMPAPPAHATTSPSAPATPAHAAGQPPASPPAARAPGPPPVPLRIAPPVPRRPVTPPVLYPASSKPAPPPERAAPAFPPEIDADAIAELAPPGSLPEGTLEPWLAQVLHGYCPPEATIFHRPPPPTTFPGRDNARLSAGSADPTSQPSVKV